MKKIIRSKYFRGEAEILFGRFPSDELAIVLEDPQSGEPIAKVSISCEPYGLPKIDHDKEVYIKDYAECRGMLDGLTQAGIIEPNPTQYALNAAIIWLCKLSEEAIKEARKQGVIK